jgi:hypothetical protein
MEQGYISVLTCNKHDKTLIITYDHLLQSINLSFKNDENIVKIDLIADSEISQKFGSVLDSFGFQDGESNIISTERNVVKELISLLFSKSKDLIFN